MTLSPTGYLDDVLELSRILYRYDMDSSSGGGNDMVSPSPTEKPPRCPPVLDEHRTSSYVAYIICEYISNALMPSLAWIG